MATLREYCEDSEDSEYRKCFVLTSIWAVKESLTEYSCFQLLESQIIRYILSLHHL
jgi:hypothetical protein